MKQLLKYIFLLVLMGCCRLITVAQTDILNGLTVKDGLAGSIVYDIYKDSEGFVWIASDKGVNRFDGYHLYTCEGVAGTPVMTLAEGENGTLYAGNEAGVWIYDPHENSFRRVFADKINGAVRCILTDKSGRLFVGGTKGLFVADGRSWKHILPDRNVFSRNNHIVALAQGEGSIVWAVGETGVYKVDWKTERVQKILGGEPKSYNCLARWQGKLYIGTRNKGILCYDDKIGKTSVFAPLSGFAVKSLSVDTAKQLLYAGTDGGGVFFLSATNGAIVRTLKSNPGVENTLRSNSVYSCLVDRDGILWVGYFQMGLDYTLYRNNLFSLYALPPLFNSFHIPVRAIAMQGRQKVIGSRDGLYFIDEQKPVVRHYTTPELASNMIFSVLYYNNAYWIGTAAGLYKLDPSSGALELSRLPGIGSKDELFFSLFAGKDGRLWIGTSSGLYCCRDGRQTERFQTANSQLPGNIIYHIYEDRNGRLWIVTDKGLCFYEPSTRTIRTDLFPDAFPWKTLKYVYETSAGQFFFITKEGKLVTASGDLKQTEDFLPGLFTDGKKCMFLVEDNRQGLWIGTDNGLFCRDKAGILHAYTFRDGVPDPTFFSCQPFCMPDGSIWFGNSQGLLRWNRQYVSRQRPYSIRVTDVLANNKSLGSEVFTKNGIRLSSSLDELTFRISDFSFTDPSSVMYEYRLEGQDHGWKTLKGSSDITYYSLSSGFYTLKIRLAGVPSSEVSIPVSIGVSLWLILPAVTVVIIIVVRIICFRSNKSLKDLIRRLFAKKTVDKGEDSQPLPEADKYRNNKVDEENCIVLEQRLEHLMEKEKMFLNPDLKLKDLADRLNVPVHNLSYVLNIYMHIRFNDFVNNYRVMEFKSLVSQTKYRLYTLDALSSLCGFSSKTSFFRHFKRLERITPSEYIKCLENESEPEQR